MNSGNEIAPYSIRNLVKGERFVTEVFQSTNGVKGICIESNICLDNSFIECLAEELKDIEDVKTCHWAFSAMKRLRDIISSKRCGLQEIQHSFLIWGVVFSIEEKEIQVSHIGDIRFSAKDDEDFFMTEDQTYLNSVDNLGEEDEFLLEQYRHINVGQFGTDIDNTKMKILHDTWKMKPPFRVVVATSTLHLHTPSDEFEKQMESIYNDSEIIDEGLVFELIWGHEGAL